MAIHREIFVTNTTQSDTQQSSSDQQGFGATLSHARKKRGLTVDEVAAELNILKRHVQALEDEDFAALPQRAFARGFVVNYAKLMEIDADEVVKQFESVYPSHLKQDKVEQIKAPLQPMGTLSRGRTSVRLPVGLIVGIVAVIILGIAMLKMISGAKNSAQTPTLTEAQVADSLSPTEQAQGAALTGTGSALGVTAQAGAAVVDFWVKETVTLTVKDATGTTLMSGQQNRGGYQLTGQAPITVEIDNPERVDVNFNQSPVSLSGYPSGQKATLTLQ